MAQAVQAGRDQLQAAEGGVHALRARAAADPRDRHHQQRPEHEAQRRRHEDERHRLPHARADQAAGTDLGHRGADNAADQRMRGRRRDAPPPGDHVPGDRADQRTEHDVVVHHAGLDDALAHRGRHLELEHEQRDEIEEGREQHRLLRLEHARGDHGGDRVGRVVEAVHEVERDRQQHEHGDHPERDLDRFHGPGRFRSSRGPRPRSGWPRPRSGR